MKKVCVIGGGASGLTTIKQLMDEGHQPTCYEREGEVGGVFNHTAVSGRTVDDTILTVSNYLMSFSDASPTGHRYHWTHQEYKTYLEDYVKKFGLSKHIQFQTEVISVRREVNQYHITVKDIPTGNIQTNVFDAIAVCVGSHQVKKIPKIKGLETFGGRYLHASEYKNANEYKNKKVLCVGIGESAVDILRNVSKVSAVCTLSMRSYPYLVPRVIYNTASDGTTTRNLHATYHRSEPLIYHIIGNVMLRLNNIWRKIIGKRYEPQTDAFHQPLDPQMLDYKTEYNEQHVKLIKTWNKLSGGKRFSTKNVSFVPQVVDGKIAVNPSGIERIENDRVYFRDGQFVEVDTIIFCTGYKDNFSFLEDFYLEDGNVRNMFLNAFPLNWEHCAFIGWARPTSGGVPACAEMTARYFALLLSGKRKLPQDVQRRIEADKKFYLEALPDSAYINSLILWKRYMEHCAELIGCNVQIWRYIFQPKLFIKLLYGSMVPAQYRLSGLHSDPQTAKQIIKDLPLTNPLSHSLLLSQTVIKKSLNLPTPDTFFLLDFFPEVSLTEADVQKYSFKNKSTIA